MRKADETMAYVRIWLAVMSQLLTLQLAVAQRDTAYRLIEALVMAPRYSELGDADKLVVQGDSLGGQEALAPLAYLLSRRAGLYLRMYSPAGLATLPLRGLAPAHTAVVWNDVPVVNPMNGVPDLSLLLPGLMGQTALVAGGAAALYGSGAMGGQVELHSNLPRREGTAFRLLAGGGSFGAKRLLVHAAHRQEEWVAAGGLAYRRVRNDYPLPSGGRQPWARAEVLDATLDLAAPLGEKGQLHFFGWGQRADRQIPPSLTASLTRDVQQDRSLKAGLRWSQAGPRSFWKAVVAWQRDDILFFSDLVDSSLSVAHRYFFRLEREEQAGAWQLRLGAELQHLQGRADAYLQGVRRTDAVGLASAKRQVAKGLSWLMHARLQWVAGQYAVPSGALILQRAGKRLGWRAALSRNFRLPTFNDLYWRDGWAAGNPELQPERGWNLEAGIAARRPLRWRLTAHMAWVGNWILWRPVEGIWQPHNVQAVWARGATSSVVHVSPLWQGRLSTELRLQYVRATVERRYDGSPDVVGSPLPYLPAWSGSLRSHWRRAGWSVWVWGKFHSESQIAGTGSQPVVTVPAAAFVDAGVERRFRLPKGTLVATCELNDLFDRQPEYLRYRPMPGRSFHLTLSWRR